VLAAGSRGEERLPSEAKLLRREAPVPPWGVSFNESPGRQRRCSVAAGAGDHWETAAGSADRT
jgi:hypothetical protein